MSAMNELKVFQNSEFGEIGVLTIDGREYFPATACAKILGYAKPHNAIKQHCRYSLKQGVGVETGKRADGTPAYQTVQMNFIPEGDLYRLITHSKLPAAELFERWVMDEVLPAIRKQGAYSAHPIIPLDQLTEIIQKTAAFTVAEVIQQLLPIITRTTASHPDSVPNEPIPVIKRNPYACRKRPPSIIGKLDVDLRREVEDMLCSGQYTYLDIVEHLSTYGVTLSVMAVQRYAKRMVDTDEL